MLESCTACCAAKAGKPYRSGRWIRKSATASRFPDPAAGRAGARRRNRATDSRPGAAGADGGPGRRRVMEEFSEEQIVTETLRLYREITPLFGLPTA